MTVQQKGVNYTQLSRQPTVYKFQSNVTINGTHTLSINRYYGKELSTSNPSSTSSSVTIIIVFQVADLTLESPERVSGMTARKHQPKASTTARRDKPGRGISTSQRGSKETPNTSHKVRKRDLETRQKQFPST